MGFCDSPFVKTVFPACSLVESRRGLQAVGVVVVGIILMLILWMFDMHSWTSFFIVAAVSAGGAFAAYQLDPAGRIAVNVAAPGAGNILYETATAFEPMTM